MDVIFTADKMLRREKDFVQLLASSLPQSVFGRLQLKRQIREHGSYLSDIGVSSVPRRK